ISGKSGGALHFDGASFVNVPDAPSLNPTQLTLALWVRRTGLSGAENDLLINKEVWGGVGYEVAVADACPTHPGNLSYWLQSSPNTDCSGWNNGGFPLPANAWAHVAL